MDAAFRAELTRAFLEPLRHVGGDWRQEDDDFVAPSGARVRIASRHEGGPHHADIGWDVPTGAGVCTLWDCVTGPESSPLAAAAEFCAQLWSASTAPVCLEVGSRDGRYADHDFGKIGVLGWHSVLGPILGYGSGPHPATVLRDWLVAHPPLPAIQGAFAGALTTDRPHAITVLIAATDDQAIAEVRIDGDVHVAASDALFAAPWPKRVGPVVARQFAVLLRREDRVDRRQRRGLRRWRPSGSSRP